MLDGILMHFDLLLGKIYLVYAFGCLRDQCADLDFIVCLRNYEYLGEQCFRRTFSD